MTHLTISLNQMLEGSKKYVKAENLRITRKIIKMLEWRKKTCPKEFIGDWWKVIDVLHLDLNIVCWMWLCYGVSSYYFYIFIYIYSVLAFQALVSNDHIYSVINIVLVIQQVAVEVRGELSTKPGLPFHSPRLERMD